MNLLLYGEIRRGMALPDFGGSFREHMQSKHNPDVYAASLSAWSLLAHGLHAMGISCLPDATFTDGGKPVFTNCPLHFSLSHSGSLAAALISDAPCGVDVEIIRPEIEAKLRQRVLTEAELARGEDFFSAWTKREAAAKLSGAGMAARPCKMNLSKYEKMNLLQTTLADGLNRKYFLTALCENAGEIRLVRPENLRSL